MNVSIELEQFFDKAVINELVYTLQSQQRVTRMNEAHFVKMACNDGSDFFASIVHEIDVYNHFKDRENMPTLLYSYVDSEQAILVLETIQGNVLAKQRDAFMIREQADQTKILVEIKKLANWSIPVGWTSSYNRDEKLDMYLKLLKCELSEEMVKRLFDRRGTLHSNRPMKWSHGDLLPMNIMQINNQYRFLDWEWAGLRPATFDPVVFTLFSGEPSVQIHQLTELTHFWEVDELYCDALIVALREIKNGLFLQDRVRREQAIRRWKLVAEIALKKLEHI